MPYICTRRTDIPASLLQFTQLKPNTSQRNSVIDPPAQSKYARRPDNDTVVTTGTNPILTVAEYAGLAAYLIDRVEDTNNANIALTAARANAIALSLIATMTAGTALPIGTVNTAIQAATGGATTLTGGNSTATLADVLEILAGAVYVLPAGSTLETGAAFNATIKGSMTHSRHTVFSGSFNISRGEGQLSSLASSAYSYDGTTGAAIVLLDDDGTLL